MPWSLPRRRGDGGGHVQSQHIVNNRILGQLSADELKSVQPWLTPLELRSNVVLHEPGDAMERVYFPLSGMISLLAVNARRSKKYRFDRGPCRTASRADPVQSRT